MTKFEIFTRLLSVIPVALFILSNIFGMRYDAVSLKYNNNYRGNHSFYYRGGRFYCDIPRYIFQKSAIAELQKAKREYNYLSVAFWISTAIVIFLFNIC